MLTNSALAAGVVAPEFRSTRPTGVPCAATRCLFINGARYDGSWDTSDLLKALEAVVA
jgi:hypothetical protein